MTGSTEYFVCPRCSTYCPTEDCRDFSETPEPDQEKWHEWVDMFFADPLDCENCGQVLERGMLDIQEDPPRGDTVERFRDEVLPRVRMLYERDGIADMPARREAWNNWTDMLCKSGEISLHAYENWDQPPECG